VLQRSAPGRSARRQYNGQSRPGRRCECGAPAHVVVCVSACVCLCERMCMYVCMSTCACMCAHVRVCECVLQPACPRVCSPWVCRVCAVSTASSAQPGPRPGLEPRHQPVRAGCRATPPPAAQRSLRRCYARRPTPRTCGSATCPSWSSWARWTRLAQWRSARCRPSTTGGRPCTCACLCAPAGPCMPDQWMHSTPACRLSSCCSCCCCAPWNWDA